MNIPGSQLSMSKSLSPKEWPEILECLMDLCTVDMHGVMAFIPGQSCQVHEAVKLTGGPVKDKNGHVTEKGGFCTCTGRPKCVLCECLGPKLQFGICRDFSVPFFVRKHLRHQSALAYALAKAQVEELKPGAGDTCLS